ncbi:MAG TPA: RidA family protein [Acidobacteriaceae bacterium]|jgi:2-iminobutanoate/2-iminopropanoate deaminase|nr:RidA family protein [Acidobacteriaceae bacterium]
MSEVERISIEDAPSPKGAYSQVVRAGDFLYVSGQGPIDPATQEFVFSDIRGETRLTLENVERVLKGCGASKKNIVKCGVFLAKAEDFNAMNEVYAAFFEGTAPARTTVQATLVEPGMKVEIDCVAYLPVK